MNKTILHGHNRRAGRSKTYRIWANMLTRCRNPKFKDWARYGGRGIAVCERWLDFRNFLADMGEAPTAHTIERNDNNGNYEPGNCRWATTAEQNRNTCRTRMIEFGGKTLCVTDWARALGVPIKRLETRLRIGWSIEKALTTQGLRRNVFLTHNGRCLTLSQWSKELGIHVNTLSSRLQGGTPLEKAFSKPVRKSRSTHPKVTA